MARLCGWRAIVQQQMDVYDFSPKEQTVGWALFAVQTQAELGATLGISRQTVKNHLTAMMRKTKTRNRVGLMLALLHLADEEMPAPESHGVTTLPSCPSS